MMQDVLHSVNGHVATITLRNEGRYNAMSLAMWAKLAETLNQIDGNPLVRVVVLRGHGDKAFVSGADISEFGAQRSDAKGVAAYDKAVDSAQSALSRLRCPTIAAISGICYGGGLGLILACDLRYCSPASKFRMPAARLGLGYALPGMKRMVDVLGAANASELFYTARVYSAQDAARIGLVGAVQDDVFAYATQTAIEIAGNAPLTIAAAKLALNTLLSGNESDGRSAVQQAVEACFKSTDYSEGRAAFAEKRAPQFIGR